MMDGVTNSEVIFERIEGQGYKGGKTTVKNYIAAHADLVPAKRKLAKADPRGSRGRRFKTEPGEAYQMDWGFVKVEDWAGGEFRIACFAMICHHCGTCYIEFFPNARQESLFIGMAHAFMVMGVPEYVLRTTCAASRPGATSRAGPSGRRTTRPSWRAPASRRSCASRTTRSPKVRSNAWSNT